MEGVGWLNLYLAHWIEGLAEELRSEFVERVANKVTLAQVVVETDCEGLEQVDIVAEAHLESLKVEAHFVLSGTVVVEAEVVK